ncbi:MAG: PIN domain-containing protein [Candidatus Sulfotelmatobacter sp.]
MILVDTPVWSLALRRKAEDLSPAERRMIRMLQQIVDEGRAELLGPVRQELLSGLREESQFRRLRDYLRAFPDAPVATHDYEEAARVSNQCRRAGIATSPVDMLLCAVALDHDWEIFTTDRDFSRYQSALKIRLFPSG